MQTFREWLRHRQFSMKPTGVTLRCSKERQMRRAADREQVLVWEETLRRPSSDDVWAVTLRTDHGDIECRYHPAPGATRGAVWVGGAGGGLEGPARGLYPEACRRLQREGVAGLRLHYRRPNDLEQCVLDTLLGVEFLA